MCNLYSATSNRETIRDWAGMLAGNDSTGNMQPMPSEFPDYAAPIVRNQGGVRELVLVRRKMPTPPKYLEGKKTDPGVTNIRNVNSAHWRRWLGAEERMCHPLHKLFRKRGHAGRLAAADLVCLERVAAACVLRGDLTPKWTSVRKLEGRRGHG
jgi:putative SOS response-associated peptidase YedK